MIGTMRKVQPQYLFKNFLILLLLLLVKVGLHRVEESIEVIAHVIDLLVRQVICTQVKEIFFRVPVLSQPYVVFICEGKW